MGDGMIFTKDCNLRAVSGIDLDFEVGVPSPLENTM